MFNNGFLGNIPNVHFEHHSQNLDRDYRIIKYLDNSKNNIYTHSHNFYELFILLSGHIKYYTAGSYFFLMPGDFLFINKGQGHFPDLMDLKVPYERVAIHINPKTLQMLSSKDIDLTQIFTCSEFKVYRYPQETLEHIKEHIARLAELYYSNDIYGSEILGRCELAKLFLIFSQFVDTSTVYSFDKNNKNIQLVSISRKYIIEHIQEKITIDSISRYFFMNKYYFMHQFKNVAGISFQRYVNQIRLEMVIDMYKTGSSLSSAAHECGFQDYSVFYRHFISEYGESPNIYFKKNN